jgi:hypothetical protein
VRPTPDDEPALPAQSEEEAGIGWGEAPDDRDAADEQRLRGDQPPHWEA